MKDFWTGVNYWASHAGTEMWRRWEPETVRRDLAALKRFGADTLRVFPNWRDFQPVIEMFAGEHSFREYRMADGTPPANPWYLDETMLSRFRDFCRMAEAEGLRLIVGLITGWMSGRLFIPPTLNGCNLYTDPRALYLEQLFAGGFVHSLKDEPAIAAWDLGNECNCMDRAESREAAAGWTLAVVNAIRAADPERPVVSGMHSLTLDGPWRIADQGRFTDLLTTHPYPYWVEHCDRDAPDSFRTLLHATAQSCWYAAVGGAPCLVEEIGTMGPMICSEQVSADFLRVNLWSNWAHGAWGLLWWCAFDQDRLTSAPYDWIMCERELGLLHSHDAPRPAALALREFVEEQKALGLRLPPAKRDGVCLLTRGQDHWGVAYMSFLLGKQAGLTLDFADAEAPLPESPLYLLPSVKGNEAMSKRRYDALRQRVADGATLWISLNDGFLTEFETLTGFRPVRSCRQPDEGTAALGEGRTLRYRRDYRIELEAAGAEVVLRDARGFPLLGRHRYGRGEVWLMDLPLEEMLLDSDELYGDAWRVWKPLAEAAGIRHACTVTDPFVGLTLHEAEGRGWAVLINYSGQARETGFTAPEGWRAVLGTPEALPPFGTAIAAYPVNRG